MKKTLKTFAKTSISSHHTWSYHQHTFPGSHITWYRISKPSQKNNIFLSSVCEVKAWMMLLVWECDIFYFGKCSFLVLFSPHTLFILELRRNLTVERWWWWRRWRLCNDDRQIPHCTRLCNAHSSEITMKWLFYYSGYVVSVSRTKGR